MINLDNVWALAKKIVRLREERDAYALACRNGEHMGRTKRVLTMKEYEDRIDREMESLLLAALGDET